MNGKSTLKTVFGLLMIMMVAVAPAAAATPFFVTYSDSAGDAISEGSITIEDADGNVVRDVVMDTSGAYTFQNLEDGEYNLTFNSYGYVTSDHNLSVNNGDVFVDGASTSQSSLDVTMTDATEVTANITVQDLADDSAIDTAQVELVRDNGDVVDSASVDSNGVAAITDYEGDYTLRVSADGYQTVEIDGYTHDGTAKTVPLQEGSNGLFGGGGSGNGGVGAIPLISALFVIIGLLAVAGRVYGDL